MTICCACNGESRILLPISFVDLVANPKDMVSLIWAECMFFFLRESFNPWRMFLMIAFYHQTKTPISFWYMWRMYVFMYSCNACTWIAYFLFKMIYLSQITIPSSSFFGYFLWIIYLYFNLVLVVFPFN